jgi:IS30 family transposase
MGKQYCHLTEKDRAFLSMMLTKRYSKSKIAQILGVHRSTIYREIKRNSWKHRYSDSTDYSSLTAHKKYLSRRKRLCHLEKNKDLREYVSKKLLQGWSPWQIEGRLRRDSLSIGMISHESIYRYIYSDYEIRNRYFKKLRRKHFLRIKRHMRKPRIPKEYLIDKRPSAINNREDFGHWECDLMIFKRGIKENIITLRERLSRFVLIIKNQNKTASGTALAIISSLKKIKPWIKSITFDQGSEFKKYQWIKDCLETDVYFCHAAAPYEKGAIENANGVIRTELPRHYDISTLKQKDIVKLATEINGRPLCCLDYETPEERFRHFTGE